MRRRAFELELVLLLALAASGRADDPAAGAVGTWPPDVATRLESLVRRNAAEQQQDARRATEQVGQAGQAGNAEEWWRNHVLPPRPEAAWERPGTRSGQ